MLPRRRLILFFGLGLALIALIALGAAAHNLASYRLSWLDFGPRTAYASTFSFNTPPTTGTQNACNQSINGHGSACASVQIGPLAQDIVFTYIDLYPQCLISLNGSQASSLITYFNDDSGGALVGDGSGPSTDCVSAYGSDLAAFQTSHTSGFNPVTLLSGHTYNVTFATANSLPTYRLGRTATSSAYSIRLSPDTRPNVSMYFPSNDTASSSVPEFRNWLVDGAGLLGSGIIKVEYANTTSSLGLEPPYGFRDWYPGPGAPPVGDQNVIPKGTQLWHPPLVAPVTWFVQATYFNGADVATSSIVEFSVDSNGSITTPFDRQNLPVFYHAYNSTSTVGGVAKCSNATDTFLLDPIGNIVDAMCAAFNPDPVALQSYSQLGNDLADKPPFGYFGAVRSGLEGLTTGTSSLAFLSASGTEAFSDIFTPIRNAFSAVIILLAGFWIWNRTRNFEI